MSSGVFFYYKFLFFTSQEKYTEQSEQMKRLNKLLSLVTTVSDRIQRFGLKDQHWIKNTEIFCRINVLLCFPACENNWTLTKTGRITWSPSLRPIWSSLRTVLARNNFSKTASTPRARRTPAKWTQNTRSVDAGRSRRCGRRTDADAVSSYFLGVL